MISFCISLRPCNQKRTTPETRLLNTPKMKPTIASLLMTYQLPFGIVTALFFELSRASQRLALLAAGENQPTKRKLLKAHTKAQKRGAYQPSSARCVGQLSVPQT